MLDLFWFLLFLPFRQELRVLRLETELQKRFVRSAVQRRIKIIFVRIRGFIFKDANHYIKSFIKITTIILSENGCLPVHEILFLVWIILPFLVDSPLFNNIFFKSEKFKQFASMERITSFISNDVSWSGTHDGPDSSSSQEDCIALN